MCGVVQMTPEVLSNPSIPLGAGLLHEEGDLVWV